MKWKWFLTLILIVGIVSLISRFIFEVGWKYNLNIYIIPYSYLDSELDRTKDQIFNERAKFMIESVLDSLDEDVRYRFTWTETYYFARWYKQASSQRKQQAERLINEQRFYFTNGGWTTYDEAIPEYQSIIDQMVTGQDFLYENFEIIPKIGWQTDTYGETAATPTLFSLLGIDSLVTSRIGYAEKLDLAKYQNLNFVWEGHNSGGLSSNQRIFVHSTIKNPQIKEPFNFADSKTINWRDPLIDIKNSRRFFEEVIQPHINTYDFTDDIAIIFGGNGSFIDAETTFYCIDNYMTEIQRLVRDWTQYKYISYKFSTIDEYFEQINNDFKSENRKFSYFNGDFIPYDDKFIKDPNSNNSKQYTDFWSGFYTTHPVVKQQIRNLFDKMRAYSSIFLINHLDGINFGRPRKPNSKDFNKLTYLKQSTSTMLNHNTITGVYTDKVYDSDLNKTISDVSSEIDRMISIKTLDSATFNLKNKTMQEINDNDKEEVMYFLNGNISSDLYPVSIFNPSLQERKEIVNITIDALQAAVFNENLNSVESQITNCSFFNFDSSNIGINKDHSKKYLYFEVDLKPLETKVYFIRHIFDLNDWANKYKTYCSVPSIETDLKESTDKILNNNWISVELNNLFLPKVITYLNSEGDSVELAIKIFEYSTEGTHSGYYTFQPAKEATHSNISIISATKFKGGLVSQVHFIGAINNHSTSNESDLIEIFVTLTKHSKFPVTTVKTKLNNFKEIALRFDVLTKDSQFYVSDSMFYTQRDYISLSQAVSNKQLESSNQSSESSSIFGLNTYPAVEGVAKQNNKKIFWTVNSHTTSCQNLGTEFEFIIQRSIGNEDDKFTNNILRDSNISTLHVAIGLSNSSKFIGDFRNASNLINSQIQLNKIKYENQTISEFIKSFNTVISFIESNSFFDQIEFIGLETKQNGDAFIKLRNRSNSSIRIPVAPFMNKSIKLDSNTKYLLNGILDKNKYFSYMKTEYETDVMMNPLNLIKSKIKTLESTLPDQESERAYKVSEKLGSKETISLEPFELATFKILY